MKICKSLFILIAISQEFAEREKSFQILDDDFVVGLRFCFVLALQVNERARSTKLLDIAFFFNHYLICQQPKHRDNYWQTRHLKSYKNLDSMSQALHLRLNIK